MQAPKLAACQLLSDVAIQPVQYAGIRVSVKNHTQLCLPSQQFSYFSHSTQLLCEEANIPLLLRHTA